MGGRRAMLIALGLELVILLFMLRPILWSSYSGDDVTSSQAPMWRELTGQSFMNDVGEDVRVWMDSNGRFFPVSLMQTHVLFTIFTSRVPYKVAQLAFIVLAWTATVCFTRIFTRSWQWAAVIGAISLFAFQFRHFHDPLLQFSAQQPLLVVLFFGSLSALVLAARSGTHRHFVGWMAAAVLTWTAGLLLYETLYPLVIVAVGIVFVTMERSRRRIALWLIGIPTAVLLVFIGFLRSQVATEAPAYTMGLESWKVIPTFLEQVTGVFPFSYQLLAQDPTTPRLTSGWSPLGTSDLMVLPVLVALAVILIGWCRPRPMDPMVRRTLIWGGALMVVVPSGIIAVTRQWQVALEWGKPYVSVFFSAMGLALVFLGLVDRALAGSAGTVTSVGARRALRLARNAVVATLLVLGPMLIVDTNAWVVDRYGGLRTDREAFVEIVEAGTFDVVVPGSIVIADEASTWFWVNGAFVQWYGGPEHLRFITPDSPALAECATAQCYQYVPGSDPQVIPLVVNG